MEISRKRKPDRSKFINLLTVLLLAGAACIIVMTLFVFFVPSIVPAMLQPLPPVPTVQLPNTATPTSPQELPPTWTPLPSLTPSETPLPRDTNTPLPTAVPPTKVPTPIPGDGNFTFVLQGEAPLAIQNVTHPELGCSWTGVAGQAFDLSNAPVVGLTVKLGGDLQGVPKEMLSLTGTASQYGPGGYEFTLAQQVYKSTGTLYVQLIDQNGLPLSDKIYFDTFDACEKALVILNFVQAP